MQLGNITMLGDFLSLSHRRELARALKRRSPLAHLIVHNLYYFPRFILILGELFRLERILRAAQIRYFFSGSILSLAISESLLPHDIDLIIESDRSCDDLISFFASNNYRITKIHGDILFFERRGIKIDLFVFHTAGEHIRYYDGRKRTRVEFRNLPEDSRRSGSFRFLLRTRPLPPLAYLWYLLAINCNLPPVQESKRTRRNRLLATLMKKHPVTYSLASKVSPSGDLVHQVIAISTDSTNEGEIANG